MRYSVNQGLLAPGRVSSCQLEQAIQLGDSASQSLRDTLRPEKLQSLKDHAISADTSNDLSNMSEATNADLGKLEHAVEQIALELVFAEAGKDLGLLPANSLLFELEDLVPKLGLPAPIVDAVAVGRRIVDHVFETTALFDADSLKQITEWIQWLQNALRANAGGLDLPATPGFFQKGNQDPLVQAVVSAQPAPATPAAEEELSIFLNLEGDGELLKEFTNESKEHLQNIELGVLTLEENPQNADTLNSIFRAFHTFKGSSGFLNLKPINKLAHELESLLDQLRQHKMIANSETIDLILSGGDILKKFVTAIEAQVTGATPHEPILIPILDLLTHIKLVASGEAVTAQAPAAPSPVSVVSPTKATGPNPVEQPEPAAIPVQIPVAVPSQATSASTPAEPGHPQPKASGGTNAASAIGSSVKVDTIKLDALVDLVGEMVIAQSLVSQDHALLSVQSQQLSRNLAQLGRITKDLQRLAMSLRMVPIRSTFQKMNRLVRDLAAREGKQIQLAMSGEDTELDRNIVEEISDPLIHMVRNSVDHGVEKPDIRVQNGKTAAGTIHLRAFHEGGNIVIQISDDGGGLNRNRIISKAIEKGLIDENTKLSDKEAYNLIFLPGFSTAEKVTDISGRGVGMDVVRRNIEKLRGKVEISSEEGKGSTFTIYLPLTLAIIEGLMVGVSSQRYIIPTLSVRESFRATPQMLSTVHGAAEVLNVRGKLIPLLRLGDHFGCSGSANLTEGIVVVIEANGANRCLLVDQLLGKQEVVIKSLGETFQRNKAIAGAAILGDGRVGLILDVSALTRSGSGSISQAA